MQSYLGQKEWDKEKNKNMLQRLTKELATLQYLELAQSSTSLRILSSSQSLLKHRKKD